MQNICCSKFNNSTVARSDNDSASSQCEMREPLDLNHDIQSADKEVEEEYADASMKDEETSFLNESDETSSHYNMTWMSSLDGEGKTTCLEWFHQLQDSWNFQATKV